ncbi:11099_t:CDS:2 [Entrophospora sp. SA101]|nr:11099_t:CDS:2 [Entrophospora sp. SA101]
MRKKNLKEQNGGYMLRDIQSSKNPYYHAITMKGDVSAGNIFPLSVGKENYCFEIKVKQNYPVYLAFMIYSRN